MFRFLFLRIHLHLWLETNDNAKLPQITQIPSERLNFVMSDTKQNYLCTLHVVAALIFLYGRLAVGAGFGVGEQPQTVGSILVGFTHTSHWPESREGSAKAKWKWDSATALCLISVSQKIVWRPCGWWWNKISTYVPLVSFLQLSLATSSRSHSHRAHGLHPCIPCIHATKSRKKKHY